MKYELRQMEQQDGGAIVNNASVGALTGNRGAYIASKHGVIGLTGLPLLSTSLRASM